MTNSVFANLKFIWDAHIANPIWLPRYERRKKRFSVKYKNTCKRLNKYRRFIELLKIDTHYQAETGAEEFVFSIWFQSEENAPLLIKSCFRQLKKYYGENVKILDRNSIRKWIDVPDYIWLKWENGIISNAHFSDICRVLLLYNYGGMWFDATDYLTSPVPDWIINSDLFMFAAGDKITPTTLVQSCFIRAKKNHPLLKAWRDIIFEYWKTENQLIDYFLLHYLLRYLVENNSSASELFNKIPYVEQDPTHVLWYKYRDHTYSEKLFFEATKDTFFQKTNFKARSAKYPKNDSIAEFIIKTGW